MKTVEIKIPEGYEVDKEQSTFERIVFKEVQKGVTERIKTIDDAINELGEKDSDVIQLRLLESIFGMSEAIINNQIAVVIVKALNEGWKPNWNDSNECKYIPWFNMGSNFGYYDYINFYTDSDASSRLYLKSSKLAEYVGKQFTEVYKKFMN